MLSAEEANFILRHMAESNKLPSNHLWTDVLHLLLVQTKHTLHLASASIVQHNPALDAECFAAENAYILEQLELLHAPPFTLQRLCEILLLPSQHRTTIAGVLRGDVLQTAIRRCVLVAPIV